MTQLPKKFQQGGGAGCNGAPCSDTSDCSPGCTCVGPQGNGRCEDYNPTDADGNIPWQAFWAAHLAGLQNQGVDVSEHIPSLLDELGIEPAPTIGSEPSNILADLFKNFSFNNVQGGLEGQLGANNPFSNILGDFASGPGAGMDLDAPGSGLAAFNLGLMDLNEQSKKSAEKASNDLIGQVLSSGSQYRRQPSLGNGPFGSFKGGGAVSNKIRKLIREGKSQEQAVAIALDMAKRNKLQGGGFTSATGAFPQLQEVLGLLKAGNNPTDIKHYLRNRNMSDIPVDANGLHTNNGPVIVPSRELTFQGIDTPTMVVPIPGEDRVLELPFQNLDDVTANSLLSGTANTEDLRQSNPDLYHITRLAEMTQDSIPSTLTTTPVENTITEGEILTKEGDPWEYRKRKGIWETRRKGNKRWIKTKGEMSKDIENYFKFQEGGYIGTGGFIGQFPDGVPIQTETFGNIPENIVFPDGKIAEVNALMSHKDAAKKGDGDVVTDILPEGAYITSAYGGINIKRSDAEKIETDIKTHPYHENKKGEAPELFTFADYFKDTEKKLVPSVLAQRIKEKFPVVDNTDIFGDLTNQINTVNRGQDLSALIGLSEYEKEKKRENKIKRQVKSLVRSLEEEGLVEEGSINFIAQKGGKVRRKNMSKAQDPLSVGLDLFGTAAEIFSNISKNKKIGKAADKLQLATNATFNQLKDLSDQTYSSLLSNIGAGRDANQLGIAGSFGARTAGILGQDPNVRFTDRSDARLREALRMVRNTRKTGVEGLRNQAFRQINPAGLIDRGFSPSQVNVLFNQGLTNASDNSLNFLLNSLNPEINLLSDIQGIGNANIAGRDAAFNTTRANRNKLTSDLGAAGADFFTATGQNELFRNQELSNADIFNLRNLSNIKLGRLQSDASNEAFRLGTTNPFAGVDLEGLGQNINSLFQGTTDAGDNPGTGGTSTGATGNTLPAQFQGDPNYDCFDGFVWENVGGDFQPTNIPCN